MVGGGKHWTSESEGGDVCGNLCHIVSDNPDRLSPLHSICSHACTIFIAPPCIYSRKYLYHGMLTVGSYSGLLATFAASMTAWWASRLSSWNEMLRGMLGLRSSTLYPILLLIFTRICSMQLSSKCAKFPLTKIARSISYVDVSIFRAPFRFFAKTDSGELLNR